MSQITDGSRDQSNSIEQINQAMGQLDEVTQQNAALIEDATAATQSLEEQSYHLFEAVKLFKIDALESDTKYDADMPLLAGDTARVQGFGRIATPSETKRLRRN